MNTRFEFSVNATFGQYLPQESWLHKRDPRARLISLTLIFAGILFASGGWGLLIGTLTVGLIYILANLPLKPTWQGIKRVLPFVMILALLQIVMHPPAQPSETLFTIWGFGISRSALVNAALLITRFSLMVSLLNAVVMTISTSQTTAALFHLLKPFEKIGFPVNDLTMVVQVALRFLPLVAQITEKTAKAQASRGGDWDQHGFNPIRQARRFLPLIVPLIITSLKRAETMAVAMESRGFNAAEQRSSYYEFSFQWLDVLLVSLSIFFTLGIILVGN